MDAPHNMSVKQLSSQGNRNMKNELKKKLLNAGRTLYSMTETDIFDCSDDCFKIILDLTQRLEDYNSRFPKRMIRAVCVKMERGKLIFQTDRSSPETKKIISTASKAMNAHRSQLKSMFLARAKKIPCTALFASKLLPDWERMMPDDTVTCVKILKYAERTAYLPSEWNRIAAWYRIYLKDDSESARCSSNASHAEGM